EEADQHQHQRRVGEVEGARDVVRQRIGYDRAVLLLDAAIADMRAWVLDHGASGVEARHGPLLAQERFENVEEAVEMAALDMLLRALTFLEDLPDGRLRGVEVEDRLQPHVVDCAGVRSGSES